MTEEFSAEILTKELIQIESTNPGAYESAVGEFISRRLSGLPGVTVKRQEVLPGRFNLMAELPGPEAEPALVWICHMDTVVVGDGWTRDPFGAEEENGLLYGRGACDMKSGLACALSSFAGMAEAIAQGRKPCRRLVFIGSVDEEDFMRGSEAAIAAGWVRKQDWVLDTEPTDGQIQVAHKGRTWFEVTVTGCTAHASMPWKGADAIAGMAELIREIRLEVEALPHHEDLGWSTVTFGQITGGYRPYVVPDTCKVWIDMAPRSAYRYKGGGGNCEARGRGGPKGGSRNPDRLENYRRSSLCGKARGFSPSGSFTGGGFLCYRQNAGNRTVSGIYGHCCYCRYSWM